MWRTRAPVAAVHGSVERRTLLAMFRAALTPPSAVLSGVEMGPPLLSCATRTTVHSLSGTMRSVSMILGVSVSTCGRLTHIEQQLTDVFCTMFCCDLCGFGSANTFFAVDECCRGPR